MMQNLTLNRKVGIEMEGYVRGIDPSKWKIENARVKSDGSLHGSWSQCIHGAEAGVEINTVPLKDLSLVYPIFESMVNANWSAEQTSAGTHVHVSLEDFTNFEKVKLLYFGKAIEKLMFSLVKKYRYGSSWCRILEPYYSTILDHVNKQDCDRASTVGDYLHRIRMGHNGRSNWLNVLGSHHPTVEFRIFNCVASAEEVIAYALLAHNIVETAKFTSVQQLQFIVKSLQESSSYTEQKKKFFEVIQYPMHLKARNRQPVNEIRAEIKARAQANKQQVAL